MKKPTHATIRATHSIEDACQVLRRAVSNGWTHDEESEKRVNQNSISGNRYLVFQCEPLDERFAATLFAVIDGMLIRVINLVPGDEAPNPLSYAQYTVILNSFLSDVVEKGAERNHYTYEGFKDDSETTRLFNPNVFGFVQKASPAYRTIEITSESCQFNQERWFKFIVSSSEAIVPPDENTVRRWLIEEGVWPERILPLLVMEYQFAMSLLQYYKNQKAPAHKY
jgi:hypothetical protein